MSDSFEKWWKDNSATTDRGIKCDCKAAYLAGQSSAEQRVKEAEDKRRKLMVKWGHCVGDNAAMRDRLKQLEAELTKLKTAPLVMVIHKLEAMLTECRSSVKFDLYRYEKMAIAYGRLGGEGKEIKEMAKSEANRLWKLLDDIDGLTETNGVA